MRLARRRRTKGMQRKKEDEKKEVKEMRHLNVEERHEREELRWSNRRHDRLLLLAFSVSGGSSCSSRVRAVRVRRCSGSSFEDVRRESFALHVQVLLAVCRATLRFALGGRGEISQDGVDLSQLSLELRERETTEEAVPLLQTRQTWAGTGASGYTCSGCSSVISIGSCCSAVVGHRRGGRRRRSRRSGWRRGGNH